MTVLSDLRPRQRQLVFDLAEDAGLNMVDWISSSNDPRGYKANPKYCYEWAYIEPGKLIILNLWHANLVEAEGRILHRGNYRADAEHYRTIAQKATWAMRGRRLDEAIQTALRDNLPVRVILLEGVNREYESGDSDSSRVKYRELDPEPWTISKYNWSTGDHELARGIFASQYVDQFDLDQAAKSAPLRRDQSVAVFVRDPAVRRRVKDRAGGRCELCGQPGFRMSGGALYLETHHIIPLADGGPDTDMNVVALCAHDHRRAHFAIDHEDIRAKLQAITTS